MTERLQVVATTIVIFLLGLGVGIWTQRTRPVPPPPIAPMGEFTARTGFGPALGPPARIIAMRRGPLNPGQIRVRIDELQPQIAAFRKSVDAIESGFRRQLDTMLTSEQRRKLSDFEPAAPPASNFFIAMRGPNAGFEEIPPPPPFPGCAAEMGNMFVPMVIYRPTLDRLTELLHLNQPQQQQLKALLIERRNHLLALVDKTPPPSFKLGAVLWGGVNSSPVP